MTGYVRQFLTSSHLGIGPIFRTEFQVILLICLLFLAGCTAPLTPKQTSRPRVAPTKPKPKPQGIYHVVKAKENLFRIGKAYDINYRRLARINRIADPAEITIGQRIFVPEATRQLPVEIITPSRVTLKKPRRKPRRSTRGSNGFVWPLRGRLTSKFGPRGKSFHDGLDIAAPRGTPIRAIQSGKVIFSDRLRGYGNIIIIRHPDRYVSVYAHNRKNIARKGQKVRRRQIIAEVGRTGRVTGPHLHFEIRRNNVARNPLYYLP
ncbi:MAG: peptidoglycan DD-metalloendopeptidase family protein [Deltaproteobacteria bacterium]|nr:peptidoglycan DD-metalloendopeptidase family protein [Deltaproteobacteria bacterium]